MKFSTSNTKQIINNSNKPMFLSNKRNYSSESPTKNINKKNLNNINNFNFKQKKNANKKLKIRKNL